MQTPKDILKCVSFVGTKKDGRFLPSATCFYVRISEGKFDFFFVVTAEHVINKMTERKQDIWIRNNKEGGGFSDCEVPLRFWSFHPENAINATDVAVAGVLFGDDDVLTIPLNGQAEMLGDRSAINQNNIGIGDKVLIAGLFRNHYGDDRNIPIARSGNIASLDCGKVKTSYCGYTEAYLIEIRSLGGVSGSPVFVMMGFKRRIGNKIVDYAGAAQRIIGFVHGHFDLESTAEDGTLDNNKSINVGIAVVIPIEKVMEAIADDFQKRNRKNLIDMWVARNLLNIQEVIDAVNTGDIALNDTFPEMVIFSSAIN